MNTPIDTIADILERQQVHEGVVVQEVLVPEQCMLICIDGAQYHVSVTKIS